VDREPAGSDPARSLQGRTRQVDREPAGSDPARSLQGRTRQVDKVAAGMAEGVQIRACDASSYISAVPALVAPKELANSSDT
jgi:hypothetical protein